MVANLDLLKRGKLHAKMFKKAGTNRTRVMDSHVANMAAGSCAQCHGAALHLNP